MNGRPRTSERSPVRRLRSAFYRRDIARPCAGADHRVMKLKPLLPTVVIALGLTFITLDHVNAQAPAPAAAAQPAPVSEARKAFARIKALTGTWKGTIMNVPITGTIRPVSSGTAILHEMTTDAKGPPQQEITMFYVEDDRLLAVHYCDGNNRVRWEGKMNAAGMSIDFNMLDVTGGTKGGLLKRLTFSLIDADQHVIQGLFIMPDGKPVDLQGEFQRVR